MSTAQGLGLNLPSTSDLRIPLDMQNTSEQRRRALVFTLQHATDRPDLLELVGMLGLGPELASLRGEP